MDPELIISVLQASDSPLTAQEIARKIQGADKKRINQVIYSLGSRGVEKVPGTQPPKWRLTGGAAVGTPLPNISVPPSSEGATPTPILRMTEEETTKTPDEEIKTKLMNLLPAKKSPMSAPEIYRAINSQLDNCMTADVKRVLGDLEREGYVYNQSPKGGKPYWVWKTSTTTPKRADRPVHLEGKELFTRSKTENGGMLFEPVSNNQLENSSSEHVEAPPISQQSSTTPPINATPTVSSVEPSKPVAFIQPQPPVPEKGSNTIPPQPVPSLPGQTTGKQSKVTLAAKFDNMSLEDKGKKPEITEAKLRENIIEFFKSNTDGEFDARTVAHKIGFPTRDKVLYILEKLKDENILTTTDNKHYRVMNQ